MVTACEKNVCDNCCMLIFSYVTYVISVVLKGQCGNYFLIFHCSLFLKNTITFNSMQKKNLSYQPKFLGCNCRWSNRYLYYLGGAPPIQEAAIFRHHLSAPRKRQTNAMHLVRHLRDYEKLFGVTFCLPLCWRNWR